MLPVNRDTLRNPGILSVRQVPRWFFGHASGWPRDRIGWRLLLRIPAEFEILRYLLSLIPLVAVAGVWTRAALPLSAWHNFSPAEIACGGTGKLLIDAPAPATVLDTRINLFALPVSWFTGSVGIEGAGSWSSEACSGWQSISGS